MRMWDEGQEGGLAAPMRQATRAEGLALAETVANKYDVDVEMVTSDLIELAEKLAADALLEKV